MDHSQKLDITKIDFPNAAGLVEEIQNSATPSTPEAGLESSSHAAEIQILTKALIAVANQSWRIAVCAIDPESGESKGELSAQEIKKIGNALESMKETIGSLGIKIIDRVGQAFNAGLPEEVVTEETREGISKEQIVSTIRPTIMWHQTMVQRGAIDIAVPISNKK